MGSGKSKMKKCSMCGMPVRNFPSDENVELAARNADMVKDRRHHFASYMAVFTGAELVDLFLQHTWTGSREIATEHGLAMLQREFFYHVLHERGFEDSNSVFYRFASDKVPLNKQEADSFDYDLVVVGAGSGGITGADFGAELGARVLLVERHGKEGPLLGGDCTWFGCVPSKAIIHASHVVHCARTEALEFGLPSPECGADMKKVKAYIERKQAKVYSMETPQSVEAKGVKVLHGSAAFVDPHTMEITKEGAAPARVRSRYFLLCTGARPKPPNTPGLADVPHDTYESIWQNDVLPETFAVVGTGVIGCELAQAYCRLGSRVTLIGSKVLPREEPSVQKILHAQFARDGIILRKGRPKGVSKNADGRVAVRMDDGGPDVVCDRLLVATGRSVNVEALNLEAAGVELIEGGGGIKVNSILQTTAPHIYAAGDVTGGPQFTHYAGWQAWQAVRNALLPGSSAGHNERVLPAATFTSPEVASVGIGADAARKKYSEASVRVCRWENTANDRAVTDDDVEDGFIEVVLHNNGQILGCTVVNNRASETVAEVALAMQNKLTITDIAHTIHPYPSYAFALQQLAAKIAVDDFLHGTMGKLLTKQYQKHAWMKPADGH